MPTKIAPPNAPTPNPVQVPLAGIPGGVQWDLFSPDWLEEAAATTGDGGDDEDAGEGSAELDEVLGDLQQSLGFGGRSSYEVPELAQVAELPVDEDARAYVEHPDGFGFVREMTNPELADRLGWLYKHRGRGLSELDVAVQREWTARALGVGYFYGRDRDPALPPQLVELVGRRAPVRRLVLAVLCVSMLKRTNGVCISAPEAFMLWGVPASTWWNVIAWLEERGLLVRLRRWKNNASERHTDAPVQLVANWYGPGPELVAIRDAVLAAYGDDEVDDEIRAEARRVLLEARRDRRRRARRAARDPFVLELDAPGWVVAVGRAAYAAVADELGAERDLGRAREILSGARSWAEVLEDEVDPCPVVKIDEDLAAELERLGVEGVDVTPAELEQRARLAELEDLDAQLEHEASLRSSTSPMPPAVPPSGGAGGGPAGPAGALRRSTITVQSVDGAPVGRGEDRKEGPRKAPAGPAGPPPAPPDGGTAGGIGDVDERSDAGSGGGARYGPAPATIAAEANAAVALRTRLERQAEQRWRELLRSSAESIGLELDEVLAGDGGSS